MATVPKNTRTRTKPAARKAPATRVPVKPAIPSKAQAARLARAEAAKDSEPEKPKKPKLVRDSFTIPKSEYAVLDALKQRAALAGAPAKKSEVLRAGIKALAAMGDAPFLAALGAVPPLKTGRPAKV